MSGLIKANNPFGKSRAAIKRGIDIAVSSIALLLLWPLLGLFAVIIRIDSKGPALFIQERLGLGGVPFRMYKFRSMYHDVPPKCTSDGSRLVEDEDERITRLGNFLRLGFDELPQLINVLKGEMSLVGPRPDECYAVTLYTPDEARKLLVRPGITGLAQVMGRTSIPWKERLLYDLQYVDSYSIWLDAKIVFLTFLGPIVRRLRHPTERLS